MQLDTDLPKQNYFDPTLCSITCCACATANFIRMVHAMLASICLRNQYLAHRAIVEFISAVINDHLSMPCAHVFTITLLTERVAS